MLTASQLCPVNTLLFQTFLGWLTITPLLHKLPSRKTVPPKEGVYLPVLPCQGQALLVVPPAAEQDLLLQHLLRVFLLCCRAQAVSALPALLWRAGPANCACTHPCHGNLVWALKSCRQTLSGGLIPPPAMPTSVNTFQGSHSFGTAQETPTRCAQVASRVADVLLQFWLWKFPWEYLQHPCRMVGAWMQGFLPCLYDAGKRPLLLHIPTSL